MKNFKITEEIAHEIVNLFFEGKEYQEIGNTVGLSETTIYRFIKSRNLKTSDRIKPHKCSFDLNEVGNKYNWLTIIGMEYSEMYKTWCAKCVCDCGQETIETLRKLKSGEKKTCGKKNCNYHNNLTRINGALTTSTGYKNILGSCWASWRLGAKARNIDFLITIEDAWEIFEKQEGKCALTGIELKFRKGDNRIQTASLDRIDSSKSYTKENVQWVHKEINRMKGNLSESEFLNYCKEIIKWSNRN